jgi:hypothetical protein
MFLNLNIFLQVTAFHSHPRNMQGNEMPLKLSGKPSGSMQGNEIPLKLSGEPYRSPQHSEFHSLENQNRQPVDSGRQSSDESSQLRRPEKR